MQSRPSHGAAIQSPGRRAAAERRIIIPPQSPGPHRTVSAISVLIATVRARPAPDVAGGGFAGTERAGTRSDGRKQGRNSADGCGEDRPLSGPSGQCLAQCSSGTAGADAAGFHGLA